MLPGRPLWRYLDVGGEGTLEWMKRLSPQAAEPGFANKLLGGFWSVSPEEQLKELVGHSRERGVRVIVWQSRAALDIRSGGVFLGRFRPPPVNPGTRAGDAQRRPPAEKCSRWIPPTRLTMALTILTAAVAEALARRSRRWT
jgi:hypothetical protein